ncbi:MAG: hypothetical protein JO325_22555 [Solirubrobacterales bacterium]|nr:hypothetical protein [Solirubrobacterales bacterium]
MNDTALKPQPEGEETSLVPALNDMSDTQTSPISNEGLDEFIRQLFVCHWVLGQMINGIIQRSSDEQEDPDQKPATPDAYSMIREAIGNVVVRHGGQRIEAATKLIDEVMDAISDDVRIFPPAPPVTTLPDHGSGRRPVRRRRR